LKNLNKSTLKKIWNDPVGSKVIAFLITGFLSLIGTLIVLAVKAIYLRMPFASIFSQARHFLSTSYGVPVWIIFIVVALLFSLLLQIVKRIKVLKSKGIEITESTQEVPYFHYEEKDYYFFSEKVGNAFPGIRNELKWYNSKEALDRLEIFLKPPLTFRGETDNTWINPIWWFRGMSSMYIESFERLNKTKCLINRSEFVVEKIGVYHDSSLYKNFIYVETLPEKPTGLYDHNPESIKQSKEYFGYCWEEFGLLNGRPIKREEYDDGAAVINGKVVDASKAISRVRYLSKYNFIITSHNSPFNSRKFETFSEDIMNKMLMGEKTFEDLLEFLMSFSRNEE
jgi:hypothetical protein